MNKKNFSTNLEKIYLRLLRGRSGSLGEALIRLGYEELQKLGNIPAPLLKGEFFDMGLILFYLWDGVIWSKAHGVFHWKPNKWIVKLLQVLSLFFYGRKSHKKIVDPLSEIENWTIIKPFEKYNEKTWQNIVNNRLKAPFSIPIYFKGSNFVAFKIEKGKWEFFNDEEGYFLPVKIQILMCSDTFEALLFKEFLNYRPLFFSLDEKVKEIFFKFFQNKKALIDSLIENEFLRKKNLTEEEKLFLKEKIWERIEKKDKIYEATIGELKQIIRNSVNYYLKQKRNRQKPIKEEKCILCGKDFSCEEVSRKGKYCGTCSKEKTYIKYIASMLKDSKFFEKFLNRSLSKEELDNIKKKIGKYDPYKLLEKRIKLNLKKGWVEKDVKSWFSEETLKKLITAFNIT